MYSIDDNLDTSALRKVTLCLIIDNGKILLAMKKRGFGAGLWNGYGGKQVPGESIEETARRETKEEIGIDVIDMQRVGTLNFFFDDAPKDQNWNQQVAVFIIKNWKGDPVESEEMKPRWFDLDKIPYTSMWEDDKHWLPEVIKGKKVIGTFIFGSGQKLKEFRVAEQHSKLAE